MKPLLCWLLLTGLAEAATVVQCDPLDATVPNRVIRFAGSDSPLLAWLTDPAYRVNPDLTAVGCTKDTHEIWHCETAPVDYTRWKCTGTSTVAVMSSGEQALLDAPILAEQALQQSYTNEIEANDLCTATLSEVATRIQTIHDNRLATITASTTTFKANVDAAANTIPAMKTQLKDLADRTATGFTMVYDDLQSLSTKLGKCVRARAR